MRNKNITLEEAQKEVNEIYERNVEENKKYKKERLELKDRYLKILKEVESWQIPSDEHKALKEFAIKQIKESIDWDCNTDYYDKEIIKMNVKEWINVKINSALKDIEHHAKGYREEVEGTNERNKWIKDLKDSLEKL